MVNIFQKKYPEYYFVAKFILLFLFLYYGTEFWIGVTSQGNYYSAFCDNYLNYINWLRSSLLQAASFLCNSFGYKATVISKTTIMGFNGFRTTIIYSCIGYGILSFWTAFVISFPSNVKRKIKWLLVGLLFLWFINVLRIVLLLLYINKVKSIYSFTKHHLVYNIVVYAIIFVMIYFFSKKDEIIEIN